MRSLISTLIALCLFILPGLHAAKPASAPAQIDPPGTLKAFVEPLGNLVSWTLPEGEIRAIELLRDTDSDPKGRVRVSAFRATTTTYFDDVPDKAAAYFYWLKVTRPDGTSVNIGPVSPVVAPTTP